MSQPKPPRPFGTSNKQPPPSRLDNVLADDAPAPLGEQCVEAAEVFGRAPKEVRRAWHILDWDLFTHHSGVVTAGARQFPPAEAVRLVEPSHWSSQR